MLMLSWLACLCPIGQGHTQGHLEKLFSIPIACRRGVNVNEIGTGTKRNHLRAILCRRVSSTSFFEVPSTLAPKR